MRIESEILMEIAYGYFQFKKPLQFLRDSVLESTGLLIFILRRFLSYFTFVSDAEWMLLAVGHGNSCHDLDTVSLHFNI